MEFFKPLQKVDVAPFLKEVEENEDAWLFNTSRQDKNKIQRETQTIALRNAVPRDDLHINENQESEWKELAPRFPLACKFMENVATQMNGTLSRAVIVRLQPKGNVYLHIDDGAYYLIRHRLHLVLKSEKGSLMMSGGEKCLMREGELWFFDNRQHHQAINNSDDWRIHFIFDVLPNKYQELAKNPIELNEVSRRLATKKETKE
ncbi:MAG: aspartyl/asparaginyl beta-hydroxylase domain-containing protein [Alphaproteobacteria bacterium]|nr:aspartyl/asparaginyl beta-hydroxylase domain-containing protein [Alphaproteobacteria bacterium]